MKPGTLQSHKMIALVHSNMKKPIGKIIHAGIFLGSNQMKTNENDLISVFKFHDMFLVKLLIFTILLRKSLSLVIDDSKLLSLKFQSIILLLFFGLYIFLSIDWSWGKEDTNGIERGSFSLLWILSFAENFLPLAHWDKKQKLWEYPQRLLLSLLLIFAKKSFKKENLWLQRPKAASKEEKRPKHKT